MNSTKPSRAAGSIGTREKFRLLKPSPDADASAPAAAKAPFNAEQAKQR
jgi:hypothetical protein